MTSALRPGTVAAWIARERERIEDEAERDAQRRADEAEAALRRSVARMKREAEIDRARRFGW